MFFIMGADSDIKQAGTINNVICPCCGAYTHMEVFLLSNKITLFFIPVFSWNKRYIAKPACCEAVFDLNKIKGDKIKNGENVTIEPQDLAHTRAYGEYLVCPNCHQSLNPEFDYCPKCGCTVNKNKNRY